MSEFYATELDGFYTYFTNIENARAHAYELIQDRPWEVIPIYKTVDKDDEVQYDNLDGAVFPLPDGDVMYFGLRGMYLSKISADGRLIF